MKYILCDECHVPMKMHQWLQMGKTAQSNKKYRRRRFKCPICDNVVLIFAGGNRDYVAEVHKAHEEVREMYREQERNDSE